MNRVVYHYSNSFADAAVPELIARIAGLDTIESVNNHSPIKKKTSKSRLRSFVPPICYRLVPRRKKMVEPRLLTLGSIFTQAQPKDIIWGTGINPTWQLGISNIDLDIRAVRGPLTRRFIVEKYGVSCPEVYGDPGLLIPEYFPELKATEKEYDHLVMFQHFDEPYIQKNIDKYKDFNVYLCQQNEKVDWKTVVTEISKARLVVASTLHAVIIAEAFGIPAIWLHHPELPSSWSENPFKYNDYLLSTGREPYTCVSSVEEGLSRGGADPIKDWDKEALLNAFPREFFSE
jgi:pyruvyltransferase